jgi:protoporphyrinogen/coproporphyrinogen III oxidase
VLVIGAGLSGLAVAARLAKSGRDVLVLEAASRAGGQIETYVEGPLVVELGAEGFVARSHAVPELCRLVGIEGSLIDQLTTDTYAVDGDRLVLLPPGEAARRLGFQVPEEELGRGIRSLALGMGQLIAALMAELGPARLRLGTQVLGVERASGRLELRLAGGERETVEALVVATSSRAAARLVDGLGSSAAAALSASATTSNVSVNLLYSRQQLASYPSGSGLLFPDSFANLGLRALSLVDNKFAGRTPPGRALLRVFFRPSREALDSWDDARFAHEAAQAIARVLTVSGSPERTWVSRWVDALPIFSAAYREQVASADAALQALGVHLTGSAFHGAGIDAAVASAESVAARLSA